MHPSCNRTSTRMTDNGNISKADKRFKCLHCERQFSRSNNLKRHAKKAHPNKEEMKKSYLYPCDICKHNFNKKNHLRFHKRRKHGDPASVPNVLHKCFFCHQELKKSQLLSHYQVDHSCNLNEIKLNFSSLESFNSWKDSEEKSTYSKFISERGIRVIGRTKTHYYMCHRSGKSESANNSSGNLSFISCNKTGYFCPARIDVVESEDKSCSIKYIKCHVGHSVSDNQESMGDGISKKSSFSVLLDKIRDSVYGSNTQRIHLLSDNDLHIIDKIFKLDSSEICQEGFTAWVEEIISDEEVIFCKPYGVLLEQYPALKAEDFVLIIMNNLQKELIAKYGSKCICVDVIKDAIKVNFSKLGLVTLLVTDDDECFPCAFLISNKLNQHVASVFFSSIKAKTGILKLEAFMSDMTDTFFNSWQQVMGQPEKRLFSSWHMDKTWRKNIKKVKNKEKQAKTYKILCALLCESDRNSFHLKLSEFKKLNDDPDTLWFVTYFEETFSNNIELWSYCYGLHNGLNISILIERMHHTIKYIYMYGQRMRRLDKVINTLMAFMRAKVIRKLSPLSERLNSNLIKDMHEASYYIAAEIKEANGWLVSTDRCVGVYYVFKNDVQCNCDVICRDCKICIHTYSCSCFDSSVRWLMCKHMHFVSRKVNGGTESGVVFSCNTLQTTIDEFIVSFLNLYSNNPLSSPLQERLENMKSIMVRLIESVSSEQEYKELEKSVGSLEISLLGCHPDIAELTESQPSVTNTQTVEIP